MTAIRIIGVGSPFGDDRMGWSVIEYLRTNNFAAQCPDDRISLQCCANPANDLLPQLQGAQLAIVIDAMQTGLPANTIQRFDAADFDQLPSPVSSHGFGLREVLLLATALGDLPAKIVVYGIEMADTLDKRQSKRHFLNKPCLLELQCLIESTINDHISVVEHAITQQDG